MAVQEAPKIPGGFMWWGLLLAFAAGGVLGFARYWLGFFIIAQGACLGLLVPWLTAKAWGGQRPPHPGAGRAFGLALAWFLAANLGLMTGFGLAQPWFEPWGWLLRVLDGDSAEFVFGVATNTGYSRGVALGAQGAFWLILCAIDWAIMLFFLWIAPWSQRGKAKPASGPEKAAA